MELIKNYNNFPSSKAIILKYINHQNPVEPICRLIWLWFGWLCFPPFLIRMVGVSSGNIFQIISNGPCYLLFQKRQKEKRNIKSISGKFFNFRAITAEMHQISNQFFCMSLWFGTVVELSFFGHFSWTKPGLTAMFHGLRTSIFVFWKGWFKDFEVTNLPLASGICGKQFH